MTESVKVDVWSDIACPWCYIGKRRFAAALALMGPDAPDVDIEYHSFELSADTPVDFDGSEADFLADYKGLPMDQVQQMLTHVTDLAAAEGLAYDFDALKHTNTRKAHELLHLAKAHGLQDRVKERLLRAYFIEGRHLGHVTELVDLAVEAGLDRDTVTTALESGQFADDVTADIAQARALGINGVPFYVFDRKYGVSGAQTPEMFAQVIAQVLADRVTAAAT